MTGRLGNGTIVTDAINLNGTNAVASTNQFERILKVLMSGVAHTGEITVRRQTGATEIRKIPNGKTGFRRLFYDSSSESGITTRFEKFFFKNEHATLSLTNAKIKLSADPGASIRVSCAATHGDSVSEPNRETTPDAGDIVGFIDDPNEQNLPGDGDLDNLQTIGVWVEMINTTFTVELSGNSI